MAGYERNCDWTLELAIPGPSGGEWGSISSPDPVVIEKIYEAAGRDYATSAS
jgi:hypothetical protein